MKVKEKILVEKEVSKQRLVCPASLGNYCYNHSNEVGAHFSIKSVSAWGEHVVERPLTEQEIVDFAYLSYAERKRKYPDYSTIGDGWLTKAIKEYHEARLTGTEADPTLISEPLKASSSSGCPCNRPVLECNC